MGYSNDTLKKALSEKQQVAKSKKSKYFYMLDKAEVELPELYQIKLEKRKIGAEIVRVAISADNERLCALRAASEELAKREAELLNSAGITEPEIDCPVCLDTGYDGTRLCECVKSIAKRMTMEELSANVPLEESGFENFSLDYYPSAKDENGVVPKKRMGDIRDFCADYANGFCKNSESILFLGSAGLGKTHLSLAIAGEVLKKGYGVIYNTSQNLFLKLEEEYFSHLGNSYIDALCNTDLLIIDDLGAEFSTQFTQSALYNIVNTRILQQRPTVISTNLSLKEIEERYTARISSRFIGSYTMKKFAGMDVRQLKMTKKRV